MMSSTCFEPNGSSSGGRLYINVLHAATTIKGFYKISKNKIFEVFICINKNIKHSN